MSDTDIKKSYTEKEIKYFLNTEMIKFSKKHHGILTSGELQTLAKFIEEVNENYLKQA